MILLDWIFAARPLLLLPIWSVYLVSLHYHYELSGGSFGRSDCLILLTLTLLGAGACYLNQVHDEESDRINDKGHFLQRGIVTAPSLMAASILTSIVAIAISVLVSSITFLIALQLFLFSFAYSTPPIRLKDRPVGGFLANAYSIGFLGAIAVYPHMSISNAGLLGWDNPFYFFCAVGSVYIITTVPDRLGDAATGKVTVGVLLGRTGALLFALLFAFVAALAAWESEYPALMWLAVIASAVTALSLVIDSSAMVRFAAKLPILLLTLLAGWFYPLYLIFVVVLIIATRIYYARRLGIRYPQLA